MIPKVSDEAIWKVVGARGAGSVYLAPVKYIIT